MTRALVIPAAGAGSRLGSALPKALTPVRGRPMIDWLLDRFAPFVNRFTIVVSPAGADAMVSHCATRGVVAEFAIQATPTGMLDAIMLARESGAWDYDQVWITWCDQVAISAATARRLAETSELHAAAAVVMPTVVAAHPYIHWARDDRGVITSVLQRREGDDMPDEGEGDMGLFSLSRQAWEDLLPRFAAEARRSPATGERNFLPFIPWLGTLGGANHGVVTFPVADPIEALGINTSDDLATIERHLASA